ncbi:MAG: methyltransferase domain-containing protein [Chitinophagales bacterium]|nr:methyltransferase domain-containing protein [Chitinophagales bacterium]
MTGKKWFEEWFDSPYYHILYANRSELEAENFIKTIAAKLSLQPGAKVLDVACGKGRHSKTLAQLGFNVTGIDLSCNSIAEAKQYSLPNLQFEVWDMRNTFNPNSFDYVFNLFSSFGYFDTEEEDSAAIAAMYNNLKPGGLLIMDYINTEFAVKYLKQKEILPRGELQFHLTRQLENGFIKKKIEFLVEGEHHCHEEQLKIINRTKFEEMLHTAGFTLQHTFGDYDLHDFKGATSPRLILVAAKHA